MSTPAIVLDGQQRSALAATRALGKLGCPVFVAEVQHPCLASSSRYCSKALICPDPSSSPDEFLDWLYEIDRRHAGAVLFPMSDITVPLVLRAKLPNLRTVLPTLDAYEAVSDKRKLYEFASAAGVRVPKTIVVSRENLDALHINDFRYPVVVKPRESATRLDAGVVKRTVRYAHSFPELSTIVETMLISDRDEVLLQEYIEGSGQGVFVLYEHGIPTFFFAHKRLREKPPSGGVSVLSESIRPTDVAVRAARTLLDPLKWHGVAMVEFKVDSAGEPWLIEINARFWGSLQLAIDSGANFPAFLYQIAVVGRANTPEQFHIGRQLRWFLGDLDSLYATLTKRQFSPTLLKKINAIARFCLPWRPGLRYELLRTSDPYPAIFALGKYVSTLGKK